MKQFWTAVLALLLALTACGCDQQEDPPASAGDTGSISQHETEELQPMELTIEESEQCYRVIFADPRDMIYARLVDEDAGTANFDSPLFRGWLSLLKELQDAPPPESESSEEALATGEILLLPVSISSAGQYDELSQALGDDLVAVGYPDGGVASFYLRNPVAIPANAKETRAAWAFLQQMVSASYQNFYSGWLSTNESIEETMAEAEAQGVRPESIAAVEALLQSADQAVYYNEDVTIIVLEETAPYFDGAISQDEAIGRIQERVGLYLDEQ